MKKSESSTGFAKPKKLIRLFDPNSYGPRHDDFGTEHSDCDPPLNAEFLFYLFTTPQNCDALVGDLEERYKLIQKKFERRRANFWYCEQTVLSLAALLWDRAKALAGEHISLLSEVVIHFVFLCLFAIASVGLDRVVEHFHAHGVELVVFRVLQVIFGGATIGPTLIWLVRDLKRVARSSTTE